MEETVFTIFRILQRDHKTFITIHAMICELMINTKLLVDSDNEMYKDRIMKLQKRNNHTTKTSEK